MGIAKLLIVFTQATTLAVSAASHDGPKGKGETAKARGPVCKAESHAPNERIIELDLAKRALFDEAVRFLDTPSKGKFPALQTRWEEVRWNEQLRRAAHETGRQEPTDEARALLAKRVRAKRDEALALAKAAGLSIAAEDSALKENGGDLDAVVAWMSRLPTQDGLERIREQVRALPAVRARTREIDDHIETLRKREREAISNVIARRIAESDTLEKKLMRRPTADELRVALDELELDPAYRSLREEQDEATARLDEAGEERSAFLQADTAEWRALGLRNSNRFDGAQNAIIQYFREHPKERALADLADLVSSAGAELVDFRTEVFGGSNDDRAAALQAARDLRALADVVAPGAETGVGFAVGVYRDASGRWRPGAIVPLRGKPKFDGQGIPMLLFAMEDEAATSKETKALAKEVGAKWFDDVSTIPTERLYCADRR